MMSESNHLEKALAENGTFDPAKAKELKQKLVGRFTAGVRKVERYLWVYMCLCCWLLVFTLFQFMQSVTTKALLTYGLLTLIFFETTILIKLWYWILNNKITVMKEIKQLQLGGPAAEEADVSERQNKRLEGPLRGLSRWERTVWYIVLIGGGAAIGAVKGGDLHWSSARGASLNANGTVTLEADGSGTAVAEMSFVYQGLHSISSFNYYAPKETKVHFADSRGKELPCTVSPQGDHVHYQGQLNRTAYPGQRFTYVRTSENPRFATREGDVWTYSTDYTYGYGTNELAETVVLPEGAEIVSTTPWPVETFTLADRPAVRFEATRGANELFAYTVRYRLPTEPSGGQNQRQGGQD